MLSPEQTVYLQYLMDRYLYEQSPSQNSRPELDVQDLNLTTLEKSAVERHLQSMIRDGQQGQGQEQDFNQSFNQDFSDFCPMPPTYGPAIDTDRNIIDMQNQEFREASAADRRQMLYGNSRAESSSSSSSGSSSHQEHRQAAAPKMQCANCVEYEERLLSMTESLTELQDVRTRQMNDVMERLSQLMPLTITKPNGNRLQGIALRSTLRQECRKYGIAPVTGPDEDLINALQLIGGMQHKGKFDKQAN